MKKYLIIVWGSTSGETVALADGGLDFTDKIAVPLTSVFAKIIKEK